MYRLRSIELKNINNIENGKILIHENIGASEILGIYGPNGTGKSTLIKVLQFLHCSFGCRQEELSEYNKWYLSNIISITKGKQEGRIKLVLDLISDINENKEFPKVGTFCYEMTLSREENLDSITNEKIKLVPLNQQYEGFQISFSRHHISRDINRIAKVLCREYCKYSEKYLQVMKTSMPAEIPYCVSPLSMLFDSYGPKLISAGLENALDHNVIYIIEFILFLMKIVFFDDLKAGVVRDKENFIIPITDDKSDEKIEFAKVSRFMRCFFPDFEIDYSIYPPVCHYDGITLPLDEESYGVKKLIALYDGLHEIMINPEALMVIDEFDEGMFEFIIGEILKAVENEGKGQLIFTAHNLRSLEVLDRRNIAFATYDPEERFVTLKNIKKDNNLRDKYLRMLYMPEYEKLGKKLFHQSVLYNGPDTEEIAMALKRMEILK